MKVSISTRIAAYFGALFLAAVGLLFALWYFGLPQFGLSGAGSQLVAEATRSLESAADNQVRMTAGNLRSRRGDVLTVAENKVLATQLATGDRKIQGDIQRVFGRLQRSYPDHYLRLVIVDPATSRILASSQAGEVGQPFAAPALIQRAAKPGISEMIEQFGSAAKGPAIAIVRQMHALGSDGYYESPVLGILIAVLDPQQLVGDGVGDELLISRNRGATLLLDAKGELLAQSHDAHPSESMLALSRRAAIGFEGTLLDTDAAGAQTVVVFRHLPLNGAHGWRLVQYLNKEEALTGMKGRANVLALAGLLLSALALALISFAARRLMRPIQSLAAVARQLGDGDLTVRAVAGPEESREVAALSEAFNGMAASIERAHHTLESKVLERTAELARERDAAQRYLDIAGVMLMALDSAGRIAMINKKGCELLGRPERELLGRDWFENFIPPSEREMVRHVFGGLMAGDIHLLEHYENRIIAGSDRELLMSWTNTLLHNEAGEIIGTLSSAEDVTERRKAEDRVHYLAHFDALTGLPNRTQLSDRTKYAISLAQRSQGQLALMFLDLDQFKDINDTLGHSVGDALLVELAKRLRLVLRDEDTVSRLGGDEFIFLLPGTDARGAAHVAQKLLDTIAEPCRLEHYDLNITGSIGIALYPGDGDDLESLSQSADTAMYRVKQEGRHGFRFFTSEMQARSARNLQLVNALRQALERSQLAVHYQPQISLADGQIIGAEALLRWTHPELGDISPVEFIPAAEDSGLILSIGEWVLRQAVRQAREWLRLGGERFVMAVNLSAVQFRHPDLPNLVTRILEEEGLPPHCLELELTEGVAMNDPQGAIAVMNKLHERGVQMSIDDFGTGYSSLSQLKKFKVYKLKIDQSFVRDITTDPEDKAIVGAIIHMAQSLGLRTIAEGVETEAQLAYLREQGCDEMQGYYYSRPLPAEKFTALIQVAA
ncbi:MAG TPA: EAL domain-containing protein [Rhodocyclaceae bacterium]